MTADKMFNHKDFCDYINTAFTMKGIDKDPLARVNPVTQNATVNARRKYLEFTAEEQEILTHLLQEYKHAIKIKRIAMKPQFQGFDITRCGHITKTQFIRVCTQLGVAATDAYMAVLLKRYMDKGNADEVNYFDFCNDVDSPMDIFGVGRGYNTSTDYFPRTHAHKVAEDIVRDKAEDIEDLLAKLRMKAKEQRIRFGEFIRDFDKLRSGFVTDK